MFLDPHMITEKFGRYTVIETLGAGSMGAVYKAEDPDNGKLVAVKHVRSKVLYDQSMRERFLQDMLAVSMVSDPRICPILEIGDDGDDFYIVTPLLSGETVEGLLRRRAPTVREALGVAHQAARALQVLHDQGITHRGVKPSNIWVDVNWRPVLTDCALSRFTELGRRSRRPGDVPRCESADTLIPLGALSYMSPEQLRGEGIDGRSDVFSLGVVLYEMVDGRHPFEARNSLSRMSAILEAEPAPLTSRNETVPPTLDRVVRKALAKDPGERYHSASEFAAELGEIEETNPTVPAQVAAEPTPAWYGRRRVFWALIGIAALALTAVLLFVGMQP